MEIEVWCAFILAVVYSSTSYQLISCHCRQKFTSHKGRFDCEASVAEQVKTVERAQHFMHLSYLIF